MGVLFSVVLINLIIPILNTRVLSVLIATEENAMILFILSYICYILYIASSIGIVEFLKSEVSQNTLLYLHWNLLDLLLIVSLFD